MANQRPPKNQTPAERIIYMVEHDPPINIIVTRDITTGDLVEMCGGVQNIEFRLPTTIPRGSVGSIGHICDRDIGVVFSSEEHSDQSGNMYVQREKIADFCECISLHDDICDSPTDVTTITAQAIRYGQVPF